MATDTLEVLNGRGHLSLSWDPENADEVAAARAEVEQLKKAGYSFFLVNDVPADEVAAGHGALDVRKIDDPTTLAPSKSLWPVCRWNCPDCVNTHPCGNCPDCPPLAVQEVEGVA